MKILSRKAEENLVTLFGFEFSITFKLYICIDNLFGSTRFLLTFYCKIILAEPTLALMDS